MSTEGEAEMARAKYTTMELKEGCRNEVVGTHAASS